MEGGEEREGEDEALEGGEEELRVEADELRERVGRGEGGAEGESDAEGEENK